MKLFCGQKLGWSLPGIQFVHVSVSRKLQLVIINYPSKVMQSYIVQLMSLSSSTNHVPNN
jgi:hypothetical protein